MSSLILPPEWISSSIFDAGARDAVGRKVLIFRHISSFHPIGRRIQDSILFQE
jgi:hypothetical protein